MPRRNQSTPLIVANWKMQFGVGQAYERMASLKTKLKVLKGRYQVVVCPSYLSLPDAKKYLRGSQIQLGAQDVFWHERGAYTGAISPLELRELGVDYVIIGHSERRHQMGETDEMIGRKMISAYGHNLIPILCVGETAHDRNDGRQDRVVAQQLISALKCLPPPSGNRRLYIAYEPVWAVGTGEPASAEQANDMLGIIKQALYDLYSVDQVEKSFRILYGGSVDTDNIGWYIGPAAFGGALVGNASLDPNKFSNLIEQIAQKF